MIRRVWPLTVAAVALGIDAYVVAGILPQIATSLAVSLSAVGLGVTAFTGAYTLAGPLLSARLAKGGAASALLIALGVFNLGNVATALAPGLAVFLASRVVAGVGAGVLTAVATATAAAMAQEGERGRAMSLVTLGLSAGTVAGVPVGMLLGHHVSWRWTVGLVIAVGAMSQLVLTLRARSLPNLADAIGEPPLSALQDRRTALGVTIAFLLGVASLGLYTYLLPMAKDAGLGDWGFTLVWAWGVGGVAGSALIGRSLDRFGASPFLIALPIALMLCFVILWLTTSPILWLLAAATWGAAGWASVPTLQKRLTQDRPNKAMAIVAFQMAAIYLGSASGAAIGSALLDNGVPSIDLPAWTLIPGSLTLGLVFTLTRYAKASERAVKSQRR